MRILNLVRAIFIFPDVMLESQTWKQILVIESKLRYISKRRTTKYTTITNQIYKTKYQNRKAETWINSRFENIITMWKDYVQKRIDEEDRRIQYREKLRYPALCDQKPSLSSDCCCCRKLYWENHMKKCVKKELPTIGMTNCPKSQWIYNFLLHLSDYESRPFSDKVICLLYLYYLYYC